MLYSLLPIYHAVIDAEAELEGMAALTRGITLRFNETCQSAMIPEITSESGSPGITTEA
jgi:hypothetical protein